MQRGPSMLHDGANPSRTRWNGGAGPPQGTTLAPGSSLPVQHPLLLLRVIRGPQWSKAPCPPNGGQQAELPHRSQGPGARIYAGSLCRIRVAMVTQAELPGLCMPAAWANSCSASSVICQENGREAQKVDMLNKASAFRELPSHS